MRARRRRDRSLPRRRGQPGQAQETIRIGLPTKTYYPTIIAETALRQGLFAKEGIKAELTIYRSGAETFEAVAAGAADLQLNSAALSRPAARRACKTKAVAGAALGYYGWYLMVKTDSKISQIFGARGQESRHHRGRLGLRHAARWTMQDRKMKFTRRAARRRRPGAEHAVGQCRCRGALFAALLQDDAGEAGPRLIDYGAEVRRT